MMNAFVQTNPQAEVMRAVRQTERIQGEPIIQGYANKRLVLNADLNVEQLKNRIDALEARIAALESP